MGEAGGGAVRGSGKGQEEGQCLGWGGARPGRGRGRGRGGAGRARGRVQQRFWEGGGVVLLTCMAPVMGLYYTSYPHQL